MEKWSADFVNDPNNDYELLVEILYEDKDVAIMKHGKNGLEITWYANQNDLTIPCNWLIGLISKLKQAHAAFSKTKN